MKSSPSGAEPSEEVSRGLPSATVVAAPDLKVAELVQEVFMSPYFRVYTNQDRTGVELGGALKNVFSMAAGICDGLNFGDNTKAALVTRALAEMRRLGVAMGAEPVTFSGLSGLGDLVTAGSRHSETLGRAGDWVAAVVKFWLRRQWWWKAFQRRKPPMRSAKSSRLNCRLLKKCIKCCSRIIPPAKRWKI